jgi:serine/threonine protein kinase
MTTQERYVLESKEHGAGGFGRVIRGRDQMLERDIAVKVMNQLTTEFPPAEQERFRREARILAKLSHPNIPAIYDIQFSSTEFKIIFEFLEGKNLRSILTDEGPCQLTEVRLWFSQIASALEHAHALKIIHRDIKPENIIISPDRQSA